MSDRLWDAWLPDEWLFWDLRRPLMIRRAFDPVIPFVLNLLHFCLTFCSVALHSAAADLAWYLDDQESYPSAAGWRLEWIQRHISACCSSRIMQLWGHGETSCWNQILKHANIQMSTNCFLATNYLQSKKNKYISCVSSKKLISVWDQNWGFHNETESKVVEQRFTTMQQRNHSKFFLFFCKQFDQSTYPSWGKI